MESWLKGDFQITPAFPNHALKEGNFCAPLIYLSGRDPGMLSAPFLRHCNSALLRLWDVPSQIMDFPGCGMPRAGGFPSTVSDTLKPWKVGNILRITLYFNHMYLLSSLICTYLRYVSETRYPICLGQFCQNFMGLCLETPPKLKIFMFFLLSARGSYI